MTEFENTLKALFSCRGRPYPIPKEKVEEIMHHFKAADDESMAISDFENFWNEFVKHVSL